MDVVLSKLLGRNLSLRSSSTFYKEFGQFYTSIALVNFFLFVSVLYHLRDTVNYLTKIPDFHLPHQHLTMMIASNLNLVVFVYIALTMMTVTEVVKLLKDI